MSAPGHWSLPAEPSAVARLRDHAVAWAAAAGLPPCRLADLRLAVSEAVSNAVIHAFRGRSPGTVWLAAESRPEGLMIAVTDDGGGLHSRPDSPGLGLGLPVIATVADRFDAHAAQPGTCIEMYFTRDPKPHAGAPAR